jgi:hypothetical protein
MKQKVCIIGAGSSGIVAIKVLKSAGIDVDCYEKGTGIGGNWRYNNDNGLSSSYRSLHINTSKTMMAYSDYPMPAHYPHYPHHSEVLAYFEEYVEHFHLREHIRFNTSVTNVRKSENGYLVSLSSGEEICYSAVIVANGHHWNPRYPEPPFAGEFTGEVLHAHHYKTPDILENKNVLIVGIGNSALDIACEAARLNTGKVTISTRRGAHILPKYVFGMPFDMLGKINANVLPFWLKRALLSFNLWVARGKQDAYGVPSPKHRLLSEHPSISQDFLSLAGHGKIQVKPNISQLAGKEVVFEDGTREPIDIIIYATGYKISFPFLDSELVNNKYVEETNDFPLYKHVIHTEHDNLFFIGLCQPLGAIMPLAELQSLWISKLLNEEIALPSRAYMKQDIEKAKKRVSKRYNASKRHTIQVDFLAYQEELKKEMQQMKTGKQRFVFKK